MRAAVKQELASLPVSHDHEQSTAATGADDAESIRRLLLEARRRAILAALKREKRENNQAPYPHFVDISSDSPTETPDVPKQGVKRSRVGYLGDLSDVSSEESGYAGCRRTEKAQTLVAVEKCGGVIFPA